MFDERETGKSWSQATGLPVLTASFLTRGWGSVHNILFSFF